jgi:hypothetical protein
VPVHPVQAEVEAAMQVTVTLKPVRHLDTSGSGHCKVGLTVPVHPVQAEVEAASYSYTLKLQSNCNTTEAVALTEHANHGVELTSGWVSCCRYCYCTLCGQVNVTSALSGQLHTSSLFVCDVVSALLDILQVGTSVGIACGDAHKCFDTTACAV